MRNMHLTHPSLTRSNSACRSAVKDAAEVGVDDVVAVDAVVGLLVMLLNVRVMRGALYPTHDTAHATHTYTSTHVISC